MKKPKPPGMITSETTTTPVNVRQLIGKLISNYQPVAVIQKSFFINYVPQDLFAGTDQETLSYLLNSVFYFIARCSREACITICGSTYEDRVELTIKDTSSKASYSVLYEFQHLQLFAKQISGFLEINNHRNKETIISFNFENRLAAACPLVKELKRA